MMLQLRRDARDQPSATREWPARAIQTINQRPRVGRSSAERLFHYRQASHSRNTRQAGRP